MVMVMIITTMVVVVIFSGCADGGHKSSTSRTTAQSTVSTYWSTPVPSATVEGSQWLRTPGRPRTAAVPAAGQLVRRVFGRRRRRQYGCMRRWAGDCPGTPAAASWHKDRRTFPTAAGATAAVRGSVTAASSGTVRPECSLLGRHLHEQVRWLDLQHHHHHHHHQMIK